MRLLDKLIADYELINEIKESYENNDVRNKDKIIEAANQLLTILENLIIDEDIFLARSSMETDTNTYNKNQVLDDNENKPKIYKMM